MQTSVANAAGIKTPIRIARSSSTDIPFAWGLVKPVIVLPQSSREWSPEALRMVLLHETSHIKRNDTIWAFIGCAATVLYWFNPLIWILRKRMVIEAEKTCDDSVLRAGSDAPSYAAHLLEVARRIRRRRIVIPAGIAMARGTELEGRLLSILSNRNRVVEMKHWLVRLTAMGALLLVFSLAGLQLRAVNARGSSSLPGITSDTDQEGADTVEEHFPGVDDFVAISKSPEQVSCEELEYPREALKAGIMEGTVWVQALIDKQGKVRKAQVLKSSGYETLDDAAVKASYRCEYVPAYQDDKPVAVWISYRVNFLADDQEKPDTADEQLPSSTDFVPVTIYPEQVSCEEPEYPKEAKNAGQQGTVWVQALVDKHGKVRKAQVQKSSGHEILDDAAVKAAYLCEYKPALQDGKPVAVWITYKVSFTLADAK
jgi:TonB family protein